MQDDDVCGLQIKHDDEWVPVNPIPNALVVNVDDVVEIWSNGKYKSIEHRAVANYNKARISYATFLVPHDEVEIEPLDHMIDPKTEQQIYKKVKYGEYLRSSMKRKMEGKAHTNMAKVETLA
ncbi:probable 2-oxoglutarate/Fe(II)-dependent dioxygenase [Hibiscus syriacus]|uniref:probable 2-oxoglutarate/Fe(II)-dependent dioxygenase n=1 Tax=Hibiscus syriacus TaxID=106335 RepID=UPI0019248F56|nr:probable 2-oxoglutarate/Fe(II)-dependent dioxygenase [Hibiscus syriacus]